MIRGECDSEFAASGGLVGGGDGTVVRFHDFTADGEAEAGALFASGRADGELAEILKEFPSLAVRDARSLIADGKAPV